MYQYLRQHIKELLYYVVMVLEIYDQSVVNERVFLDTFEQRLKDEIIQK